jgi:TM2 domain-containing membrane protein YozV
MTNQERMTDLERLAELRDKGVITEDEFGAKKQELLALLGLPEPAPLAVLPTAGAAAAMPQSDPMQRISNAFILELIAGLLGFLGIGYMYAGRTDDGVVRLVVWWLVVAGMWTTVTMLSMVLIGLCLVPVALVVQFGGPIYSATQLRKTLLAQTVPPTA